MSPNSRPDSGGRGCSRCGSGLRLFGARPADTASQGVSCVIEELHQEKKKGEQLADREIGNYYNRRVIREQSNNLIAAAQWEKKETTTTQKASRAVE